ncbi:MAG: hypothetical protein GYA48_14420 [Chloroflexi bacterium]|nr:hypothetical protein [Chloroflexota bacterium]
MNSIFAFCMLFLVVPVGLNLIRRVFAIIYGPESDSEYHQQLYQQMVRSAVIEILVSLAGLALAGWVIYFLSRAFLDLS